MAKDPLEPYLETTDHVSPEGVSRSTAFVMPGENIREMDFVHLAEYGDGWCTFQARFQLAPSFKSDDLTEVVIVVGDQEILFKRRVSE